MLDDKRILLNDLLQLQSDNEDFKVKLNQTNNGQDNPLDAYLHPDNNREEQNDFWTRWRRGNTDYKVGQYVILLMKIRDNLWLLTSIRKITGDTGIRGDYAYSSVEMDEYKKFYDRIIIKYTNKSRQNIRLYRSVWENLEVFEILSEKYSGRAFPGVTEIRIPLSEIVELNTEKRQDWIGPLRSQKGIYLITIKENPNDENSKTIGRYVGSAYGEEGLWQRWMAYADTNGTGGNVKLEEFLKDKPADYARKHFIYAVLETFGSGASDEEIINRESWWKKTLDTRDNGSKDGMNKN